MAERCLIMLHMARAVLKIALQLTLSAHITGGAVERSTKGEEVSEGHRNGLEPPLLEGLYGIRLMSLHNHTLLQQNMETIINFRITPK